MKIHCERAELLKGLEVVQRALPGSTSILELTCIRLRAKGGVLEMAATDLKTFISTEIPAKVDSEGEALVQGQFFSECVRSMPESDRHPILLENLENRRLLIAVPDLGARFEAMTRDVQEYPNVELLEADLSFLLHGARLKKALKFGAHASAQTENTVQGFHGVRLFAENGSLKIASQDGWRLAESVLGLEGFEELQLEWLLSLASVQDLLKILPDDEVEFQQGGGRVLLRHGSLIFQTMLAEGQFMDYEGFFPEDLGERSIALPRLPLTNHLRGLMPVSRDIGNRVSFQVKGSSFGMESFSDKMGTGWRELEVESQELEGLSVALNSKYVLDFLGSVESDRISLFCEGEEMPVYFWPEEQAEGEGRFVCVIMSLTQRVA